MEQLSFGLPAHPRATVRCLFLALRPDAVANIEVNRGLPTWRGTFGLRGKPVVPERRHVSLLEVGPRARLPDGHVERLCREAAGFSFPPFEIRFDRITRFGGNRFGGYSIALTGSHDNPAACAFRTTLAAFLKRWLPPPKQFVAHMTVMHDRALSLASSPIQPVIWIAREFVLVESHQGEGRHVDVGRWTLDGDAGRAGSMPRRRLEKNQGLFFG